VAGLALALHALSRVGARDLRQAPARVLAEAGSLD